MSTSIGCKYCNTIHDNDLMCSEKYEEIQANTQEYEADIINDHYIAPTDDMLNLIYSELIFIRKILESKQ